jgi:ABC-2 type transport system ATP-binding protein
MTAAIEIKNLKKTYAGNVQAIKNIDLKVESGDFFALLGVNGAGKTTLINILTGLVTKTAGSVKVFGYDLDTDLNNVKRQIGVVPQEFNFSIFEKIQDIVVNQAGYYGLSRSEAEPRAIEILTKLGLGDKLQTPAIKLSGGMKRRLMIARGLIHQPRLLILDEPTAGVDVDLRHGMWQYLNELNANGTTILLTTHYLEEVEELCKNAAIIKEGQIIKNDSVKNLTSSLSQETYILDVDQVPAKLELKDFEVKKIDATTLEIVVKKSQTINQLFEALAVFSIKIQDIRPKGNRLESLFLSILKD